AMRVGRAVERLQCEMVERRTGARVTGGTSSMGFMSWIVVGAIAGFLANQIVGSREGLPRTLVLGVVGGLVGGFVATSVLKIGSVNGTNVESIVIATLGVVAILLLVHFGTGSRGRR